MTAAEHDARWSVTPESAVAAVRDVFCGHGKLEMAPKVHVESARDIATLYTPGVGILVQRIVANPSEIDTLSNRANTIAVVTDGTAVLGFGRTGPLAAVPVMEGKAIMFKLIAGLDAVPICLSISDPEQLADHIAALEPSFAGFNIEDVAAPHCFSTVDRLEDRLSVPVFHDDQYGTATVIVAALINSARILGKAKENLRVVVNGAGAAGTAAARLILAWGAGDVVVCDRHGILCQDETQPLPHMTALAKMTNRARQKGTLSDALKGADAFVGLSTANLLDASDIRSMARSAIVFACANPMPEIMPSDALAAGAAIAGSGRFDSPNQCNNVLAFPGIMRGAVDVCAQRISEGMCLSAAEEIAAHVDDARLAPDNVLPSVFDAELCPRIAEAVAAQAAREGRARKPYVPGEIAARVRGLNRFSAWQQDNLRALMEKRAKSSPA